MFAVTGELGLLAGVGNDKKAPLFQYSKTSE
jgi:hypothetical protein